MVNDWSQAVRVMENAVETATQAYRFNPGSYSYDAMLMAMKARDAVVASDWIEAYLDYAGEVEHE